MCIYGEHGNLKSIVRKQHLPIEVTDADVHAERDRQLSDDMPDGMREAMVGVLDATPISETMPAFSDIIIDQLGNIWVEEYRRPGADSIRWTVFSTQGEMLGTLPVPDRFEIYDVGDDYVLGRWRDELEIEHVLMYELVKP